MKPLLTLLTFALLCPFGAAQPAHFTNIIVIVQENRSVDNLFSACAIPGADTIPPSSKTTLLNGIYDPVHSHAEFLKDRAGEWAAKQKMYVSDPMLQPYCDLAIQYGFANRMFQTNQGPSFPAHQFLLAGTSIPGSTQPAPYDNWFAAENTPGDCASSNTGVTITNYVYLLNPATGAETVKIPPCFEHATITDLLEGAGLTWRYYASGSTAGGAALWNAPLAIKHLCGTVVKKVCSGPEMVNDVQNNPPQILTDIANGTLANLSIVTPAASYSDHPGYGNGGPSWVASIVNAIGTSQYWENTVIIITWDDWGGWYDHVEPPVGYPGATDYTYGFRVPLIVVSPYTPAMIDNTQHDFGSILHFVETNFGLPGPIDPTFADAYADDLGEFFTGDAKEFKAIQAPHDAAYFLNLDDHGDPDDD
jgi:phospholipase C